MVTQWADQSGNTANATQATAARQPGYTASSPLFNGNPSVNFDATNDGMATTASITATPYSVFVVYNATTASTGARRAVQGTSNWLIGPYGGLASFFGGAFVDPQNIVVGINVPFISTGIAGSATTGNAFNYYNGRQTNATAVTATGAPGTLHLGASGLYSNEWLGGSIAEVIAFNTNLSAAQRAQVESYLAIKYGLPLDQSVATDYVNSTGTTVWSASSNASYANNVFGIGQDNGSGLLQTASRSINTDRLRISNPSALTNGDYLIFSDNGQSPAGTVTTGLPSGLTSASALKWTVSKTGTVGTVDITINAITQAPTLLIDNDNNGSYETTATAASVSGSNYTFTALTLNNNAKIALGYVFGAPGGIGANLRLWLKAGTGVTTASGSITGWADQSGSGNNVTGVAGTGPTFVQGMLNGYPVASYSGAGGLTGAFGTAITSSRSAAYIVTKAGSVINSGLFTTGVANADPGSSLYNIQFIAQNSGVSVGSFRTAFRGNYTAANAVSDYHLYSSIYNTTQNLFYNEGKAATASAYSQAAYNLTKYALGGWYNGTSLVAFPNGQIAEVIFYDEASTALQQQQIQSYLALKYGFSLDQTVATDYLNSSGTAIYNSGTGGTMAGYGNDVAGILVDNGSGLSQTASRSITSHSLMAGISNPSTALSNGEYIIAGDNAAPVGGRSTDVPAGYGKRLSRVWRVAKSAAASTVTLKIFIGDIPELVLAGRSLTNVAILKSSSTIFSGATAYAASGTSGNYNDTLVVPNVALGNNDYFTLSLGANTTPNAGGGDFDFWFGVPEWSAQFPTPQKLHFTGASPTDYAYYIIDMPANAAFTPITGLIAPGAASVVDMTNYVAYGSTPAPSGVSMVTRPANTVVNAGLRITVKGQMGAYYANENIVNFGSFPLRGPNALGTSFYIPGQNRFANQNTYLAPTTSEITVVATQNNTLVTITPTEAIVGHGANVPFTVILNQGQSYQAQNTQVNGIHLAGSLVVANKPVVVTYSDDVINSGNGQDNAGDQLVPSVRYGNDYVHIRTSLTFDNHELAYLIGSQPNTTVTIYDGTTTRTRVIGAGQMDSVSLKSGKNVEYIHSDKPILVHQIGGSVGELGSGILTPAVSCKGTNIIAFQYNNNAGQANFNFVVPAGIEGAFVINGSSTVITAADFAAVPGYPAFKWCRKDITALFTPGQTITIRNTAGKFFFYQNMKTSGGGDFSNFSDFGNVVMFPKPTYPCTGSTVTLNSGAIAFNATISGYSWTGPNGFTSNTANPTRSALTQADSGWYKLTVTDNNGCPYTDSILVDRPITAVTVTPTPSSACVGSTVNFISTQTGGGADSVKWTGPASFVSTQRAFSLNNVTTAQAGTYTATYYDRYGCPVSGSTSITVSSSTISPLSVGGIDKLSCGAATTTLNAGTYTQGIEYQLYNPFRATSIFATSNFSTVAPGFYNQTPAARGTTGQMNLSGLSGITGSSASYAVHYEGYLYLASAGTYTFYVNSKDGSNLYIDGSQLVTNDGTHALTEVASSPVTLSAGYHKIGVNYFVNAAGSGALTVSYSASSPSIAKTAIPASMLYYASATAPSGSGYTGYTYNWSGPASFTATGSSATITAPGTYNLTATEPGGCSSITRFAVSQAASYDYGDLPDTWPSAQAAVAACPNTSGVPTGTATAVWAGTGVSYETNVYTNAQAAGAGADGYDDGLQAPSRTLYFGDYVFNVTLNSNLSGKTVYYGLWFDWNNNGNFADDTSRTGSYAFYSGSGVTMSPVTIPVTVGVPHGISTQYKTRLIVSDAQVGFADFANIISNGEIEDFQAPAVTLPLNYGTVKAVVHGCSVAVDFETYNEHEGSRYFVERSADGQTWHTAATLRGQAGSKSASGTNSYRYVDATPYQGGSFYRVREITPDNTYTVSAVMPVSVSCDGKQVDGTVQVYPNPASSSFRVELGGAYRDSESTLLLYNALGQQVTVPVSGSDNIRTVVTSGLPDGVYQLRLTGRSGWTSTRPVMILNK